MMDNHRGISLISSTMVIRRIGRAMEQRSYECGGFNRGQGGFRSREECIGQVISLFEITKRRKAKGLATFAAYIDFQKAYDRVPHEALLHKLWLYGVRGKAYGFVRALYTNSYMNVLLPCGKSPKVQLLRGVR